MSFARVSAPDKSWVSLFAQRRQSRVDGIRILAPIAAVLLVSCAESGLLSKNHLHSSFSASEEFVRLQQVQIHSEILPSGMRVVLAKTPPITEREPRAYIGIYLLHGSMDEKEAGLAHMMEHIASNNPPAIPGPAWPEGLKAFDSNAMVRPYYSSFFFVVPPELFPTALHFQMAVPGRKINHPKVFANEVGRVVSERERGFTHTYPASVALANLATGLDPSLVNEIARIQALTHEELKAAMLPIYRPDNAVLVVTGDIEIEEMRKLVRDTDDRLAWGETRQPSKPSGKINPALKLGQSAIISGQNRSDTYVVGAAWPKPRFGDPDQLATLVVDQLLLGGREDPADPSRSAHSPLGSRLAALLGAESIWDGRTDQMSAPEIVDFGLGLHMVVFRRPSAITPSEARTVLNELVGEILKAEFSDQAIRLAAERLASYYEGLMFEPRSRAISDLLMAYAAAGRDPAEIKNLPNEIRAVRPNAVRAAFDRYFLREAPNIVIMPPDSKPED